jgi:hypothetical protein
VSRDSTGYHGTRKRIGRTLSIDLDTRAVLMAQRLPERVWRELDDLRQAIERFANLQRD